MAGKTPGRSDDRRRQQARNERLQRQLQAQDRQEAARQERAAKQEAAQAEREQRDQQVRSLQAEAERRTRELDRRCDDLATVLSAGLDRPGPAGFDGLRRTHVAEPFRPGPDADPEPAPRWEQYAPAGPGVVTRLFGSESRRRTEESRARGDYERDLAAREERERARRERLARREQDHRQRETERAQQVRRHNERIDELERAFRAGDQQAVETVLRRALQRPDLPDGVPVDVEVGYRPASGQVLVVRTLPAPDVIPAMASAKFVKAQADVTDVPRKAADARNRYADLLAQVTLLSLRDVFAATTSEQVSEVTVQGFLTRTDRATGRTSTDCLLGVSVTRDEFDGLVLREVDPQACLRRLNALVSPNPYDVEPVRPLFDPDLSRFRLVDAEQVAAGLDSRTVLVDLTPNEFEHLVRELFEKMGMQSWVTQASRDDGVDGVAVNPDQVMGGLAVIQAKRYRNIVPAEAVRALWGTMEDKKAGVGILVTTSYFGKATHDFAHRNERVRLIEGPELKQLIAEHLRRDVIPGAKPPPRRR